MISFQQHAGVYTLESEQLLPITIDEAWSFFSAPKNLQNITPVDMNFRICSKIDKDVYPGQIITYEIGIFPMIKTKWVTEITHVNAPSYFVDEQRLGPYKIWHHEHWFEVTKEGIKAIDKVTYKLPFGMIGRLFHPLFIQKKLTEIFTFRHKILEELFCS